MEHRTTPYPLPAGDVLNEAFQFGLRRWGTVFRFVWAPVLLSVATVIGFGALVVDWQALESAGDPAALYDFDAAHWRVSPLVAAVFGFAVYMVCVMLYAGFMASIYRLVALGEERPGIFQVRADGPAVRVFWAMLIHGVLTAGVYGVALLAALAMTGQSAGDVFATVGSLFLDAMRAQNEGAQLPPARFEAAADEFGAFFLSILFSIPPLAYLHTKLAPFAAGSAAENRILLIGSFHMTRGRFWPILGALFLTGALLFVVWMISELAAGIFELISTMFIGFGGAAAVVGGILAVVAFGISLFFQIFSMGVQLSIQAVIYRRLKTGA